MFKLPLLLRTSKSLIEARSQSLLTRRTTECALGKIMDFQHSDWLATWYFRISPGLDLILVIGKLKNVL